MSTFLEAGTTYHLGLCIAGTLRQSNRRLNGIINNNGRNLTAGEVRIFLGKLLQENPVLKVFSGDVCDNQNEQGECQGHPSTVAR